ncbi:MAG: uncharacterized protein K0R36_2753 [Chryseobacterium sp.]|jgi:hypothetical protein|nr:uncharacterized protein [Chryseobacterium sp.]
MKNKIDSVFDSSKFSHESFITEKVYIADYTERTASLRSVEIHDTNPTDIDSLIINNPTEIHISTSIFSPQCFIDDNGKEPKQCECIVTPTTLLPNSWILFIEIKDCKPKNVSTYHKECKEKILENVKLFREKEILDDDKVVYAVVSFPRTGKTNFHNHLIKATEWKQIRDEHKIMIKGTNEITIKNEKSII